MPITAIQECDATVVERLDPGLDPEQVFRAFSRLPHAVFFDSAMRDARLGAIPL